MSSDLVILVAPATGPLQDIVGHLADWAALGVANGFVVSTASSVGERQAAPAAWWVDVAGSTPVRLPSLVAQRNPDRFRVVLLTSPLDEVRGAGQQDGVLLVRDLRDASPHAVVVQINLVISRGLPSRPPLALEGWHNVLVSPEQSIGPDSAREDLGEYSSPDDLAHYAAPVVAALSGMLSGADASPLDDEPPPPGVLIRSARAFVTALDAGHVEDRLRDEVVRLDGELPTPSGPDGTAVYIENEAKANADMALAVWKRHRSVLRRHRQVPARTPFEKVKLGDALRMMISFLLAALRRAPGEWWSHALAGTKRRVAGAVSQVVFGSDSAYQIVIDGMAGDLPATWWQQAAGLSALDQVLLDGSGEHEVHLNLSGLWRDVASAAFTLCDAQERDPQLPAVRIGDSLGVHHRTARCVAPHTESFALPPGPLTARLGDEQVSPSDYLGARTLFDRLGSLREDPDLATDATRVAQGFQSWKSAASPTFGWQMAKLVGGDYLACLEEIRQYVAILREVGETDVPMPASQRSLGRRLVLLLVLSALVIVGVVGVAILGIIGWLVAGGLIVITLAGWLGGSVATFISHQMSVFRLIHRRREAASVAQVAEANLREAVADARRLGDCYRLLLTWERIIAAFLADPLAGRSDVRVSRHRLGGGAPFFLRFGSAGTDPMRVARTGLTLKGDVFGPGWLSRPWLGCLRAGVDELGPRGVALGGDPQALWQLRANEDELLIEMADALERDGVASSVSGSLWQEVMGRLTPDATGDLIGTVEIGASVMPLSQFLAPRSSAHTGHLSGLPYTPLGRNQDAHLVQRSWIRRAPRGLGWIDVLVQLSQGGPPGVFATTDQTPPVEVVIPGDDMPWHSPTVTPPTPPADFTLEDF